MEMDGDENANISSSSFKLNRLSTSPGLAYPNQYLIYYYDYVIARCLVVTYRCYYILSRNANIHFFQNGSKEKM